MSSATSSSQKRRTISAEQRQALDEIQHRAPVDPPRRQSRYTVETVDEIMRRIALGESIYEISQDEHMPAHGTMCDWLYGQGYPPIDRDELAVRYTRAREQQALRWGDEIVGIADTEDDPRRAQVRIDARKWVSAKLLPRVYGDRHQVDVSGQVQHAHLHAQGDQSDLMALLDGQIEIEESEGGAAKQVESRPAGDPDSEAHSEG